jgi:RNA polymerase sigma-32 factor
MFAVANYGLKQYLQEIKKYPFLSPEEEYVLAKRYKDHGDIAAAHKLATSQLLLVVKIAKSFLRYGLPINDLISEGNIGLMKAIQKFDPDKGFRFVTYAIWWIRSSIHEYILRSWSIAKISLTAAQKKVFFNLRKIKNQFQINYNTILSPEKVKEAAKLLAVPEKDIMELDIKMSASDVYLDCKYDSDNDNSPIDSLCELSTNQEINLIASKEESRRHTILENALAKLNPREQFIIRERRLKEEPPTLRELADVLNVKHQRVQQIESAAFDKLQKYVTAMSKKNYEECKN